MNHRFRRSPDNRKIVKKEMGIWKRKGIQINMINQRVNELFNNVYIIENHDEALKIWKDNKIIDNILIHVDAHLDYDDILEETVINIGNFLGHAVKQKLLSKIIWVIPENTLHLNIGCKFVKEQLNEYYQFLDNIKCFYHGSLRINSKIEIFVCTQKEVNLLINNFEEKVILDIDIDYFFNKLIFFDYSCILNIFDIQEVNSFCYIIKHIASKADIITLAKSVNGGYTPLRYDFLVYYIEKLVKQKEITKECVKIIQILTSDNILEYEAELINLIQYEETNLSAMVLLIENKIGSVECLQSYLLKIKQNHPEKLMYLLCVEQNLRMDNKKKITKYLDYLKELDQDFYNILNLKLKIKKLKYKQSKYNIYFNYLLAEYFFYYRKYSQVIEILEFIYTDLFQNKTLFWWEGMLTSYAYEHNMTPVKIKVFEMLCISYYEVKEIKKSYTYAYFLMRYGYVKYNVLKIFYKCQKLLLHKKNTNVRFTQLILTLFGEKISDINKWKLKKMYKKFEKYDGIL